jgi:hypothetical protein
VPLNERVSSWWSGMEERVPLLTLAIGGSTVLAALAILFGFIGIVITSTSSSDKLTGATLSGFGVVLATLAIALVALDGAARRPSPPPWGPAFYVGAALVGVSLLFSVLGAIKAFGSGVEQFDGFWAWLPFGTIFAFLAAGWLLLLAPASRQIAKIFTGVAAGASAVLAVIGLATGVGASIDSTSFYSHGLAWLSWAFVWAVLAIAGGLAQREP